MHQAQRGFDRIELMIGVVILGILAAIAIPWTIAIQNRNKDEQVRANMYTLQLATEDYGDENDGYYAHDPAMVRALLPGEGKYFKNPVSGKIDSLNSGLPGSCFYEDSAGVKYTITGYDHAGNLHPTILTNERDSTSLRDWKHRIP